MGNSLGSPSEYSEGPNIGVENIVGKLDFCSPCKLAKTTRHPHYAAQPDPDLCGSRGPSWPLDLFVIDLAGPNKAWTLGGAFYDMVTCQMGSIG